MPEGRVQVIDEKGDVQPTRDKTKAGYVKVTDESGEVLDVGGEDDSQIQLLQAILKELKEIKEAVYNL